ncbi:DUF4232 domain-containing protein [Streptomyces sp. NPDC051976]|uniref:DUF4232 domain-containing protein n=1 Tax=Streptomyces sp. NPDC051976 TaxID=3154947 RepID=UPI0034228FB2
MRIGFVHVAALGLSAAAALTLTACDGKAGASGTPSATTSSTAAPTASASASASADTGAKSTGGGTTTGGSGSDAKGTQSSSGTTGSAGASHTCLTAHLGFGYGPDSGAQSVGSPGAVVIKLTNKGTSTCVMDGFPGVDLHTNYGVISVPRTKRAHHQVTLKPGASTLFDLNYMPNSSGGTGVKVSTMVITPPNETHSHSMPWEYQTLPVTNGTGKAAAYPNVDPIGYNG